MLQTNTPQGLQGICQVPCWLSSPVELPCFCGWEDPNKASPPLVLLLNPPQHFDLFWWKKMKDTFWKSLYIFKFPEILSSTKSQVQVSCLHTLPLLSPYLFSGQGQSAVSLALFGSQLVFGPLCFWVTGRRWPLSLNRAIGILTNTNRPCTRTPLWNIAAL